MTDPSPSRRLPPASSTKGLTLREAVERRAMRTPAGSRLIVRLLEHEYAVAANEVGPSNREQFSRSGKVLPPSELLDLEIELFEFVWPIRDDLAAARLLGRGFPRGSTSDVKAVPNWWAGAKLDWKANTAEAHGVKLSGVTVYTIAPISPLQAGKSDQSREMRAQEWMQFNVTEPGQWKRENALQQCRSEADVTARVARDAWTALPAELKGTRGKHKG